MNMCSETSPRISFSHDLCQADAEAVEEDELRRDSMLLDSNPDFEFSIENSFEHESSSADELFANGLILPVQIQERVVAHKCSAPPTVSLPPPCSNENSNYNSKKEIPSMREIMVMNGDLEILKPRAQPQPKAFWGFKRSSSLNHDVKKSLICSLPLLSRSNSTGSVPNKKAALKDVHKQSSQKHSSTLQPKPPLKKTYMGPYGNGNGVKISPVLNVPPPYISRGTASLFGLGSLLRSGSKHKTSKKLTKEFGYFDTATLMKEINYYRA